MKVVFFGHFVAILRCLAAFLAGVNQLPWPRFLLANAAGGVVWATVIGLGAYFFGRQFTHIVGSFSLAAFVFAVIGLVWGFIFLSRHEDALVAEAERALPGPVSGGHSSQRSLRSPSARC